MQRKTMPEAASFAYLQKIHRLMIDLLDEFFGRVGVYHALAGLGFILIVIEQHGISRHSVSPGAPCLLVITL